jgi:hypothetical protein
VTVLAAETREELEIGPVVAGRLQSCFARPLRDPRRRGHLVERPSFAAAHRVAGQREQVPLQIGLADPADRVFRGGGAGRDGRSEHDNAEAAVEHARFCGGTGDRRNPRIRPTPEWPIPREHAIIRR